MSVVAAAVYSAHSLLRYATFRAGTYDLVIFDQAVRSYSRFRLPVAIVKGVHNGFGPDFSVLGDHWSPILAVLAPLYWVHDGPETLLVAQAVLLAAAVPFLWLFTARTLGRRAAYCVSAGYALSWPVAEAVGFDFHEAAFAPVLTAVTFERLSALRAGSGRWWQVVLPALLLLGVKEDMGLLVAGFGLFMMVRRQGEGRFGIAFFVGGLAAAAVSTKVLIPYFGGRGDYYWAYNNFGPTMPAAARYAITHPWEVARTFVSPGVKLQTLLWLLAPAAFASLASPYALSVLPLLAVRMLSDGTFPAWWGLSAHYNVFLVVPLLCAGVDGVARLAKRRHRVVHLWAGAVVAIGVAALPFFSFKSLVSERYWAGAGRMDAAAAAAAQIPDGALVESSSNIGARLTGRTRVLLLDRVPRWAPWVVADVREQRFQFCDVREQQARVEYLLKNGYRTTFERDGYLVLHRPGPELRPAAVASPHC
ncbi:DUF2079 domain-containing protein [Actinomadura macrotermitis]|uniref:DUF2079 domain-containing protein n=1 Tax=Actinomadura macrotermitis TaxID=2585200 RepID=A0A7K0BWZ0_9ACTN|nr:DUF2079 domain-containing protein [Actinomadura macrotermitis]MQY05194.1 hypothetical protein [Actinomadura macrotermitis]